LTQIDNIYQIPAICAAQGIENAIICPGSRSAPLTLAFVRHPKFKTRLIFDERSAAYIALGMAQKSRKTVVLICTSGTAALNFAPAIAEAFWQQIPLLVLTGDRPPEWIGQGDGQTINQNFIYQENCKAQYALPPDRLHPDTTWLLQRTVNEAISKTQTQPLGPVHINVAAREPFYPEKNTEVHFEHSPRIINAVPVYRTLQRDQWKTILALLLDVKKIAIIAGHQLPDNQLFVVLNSFQDYNAMPLLADVNSNLMGVKNAITHSDLLISSFGEVQQHDMCPELLISFGNEFVSKSLKQYLRKHKPKLHFHISESDNWVDTFQSVTHFINVSPTYFFAEFTNKIKLTLHKEYLANWLQMNDLTRDKIDNYQLQEHYDELCVSKTILDRLPKNSVLHLSNSLPVRYANMLGIANAEVYCNRGTSGIDGCVSTAVGSALETDQLVTLLSGDVAFLYDRNAFWHHELPTNLRFIVINNGGGQIFRTIAGAKDQPELEAYFVGKQTQDMQFIAKEYGLEYTKVTDRKGLKKALATLYKADKYSKILEVIVDGTEALHTITAFKAFVSLENN